MSAWDIYWLTRLEPLADYIYGISLVFTIIGGLIYLMISWFYAHEDEFDKASLAFKKCCRVVLIGISIGIIPVLIPTKSDLAIIFAGQWVTNSDEMQKLPNNVARTINKFMSEYVEEKEGKEK